MATVVQHRLLGCDGFRVESPEGLLGWIEETWLGPSREATAVADRGRSLHEPCADRHPRDRTRLPRGAPRDRQRRLTVAAALVDETEQLEHRRVDQSSPTGTSQYGHSPALRAQMWTLAVR